MIQSDHLDWAIAMAVVFFLGGLVVSGLNEGMNWATRVRSKFLWAYLHDLLSDRSVQALPNGAKGCYSCGAAAITTDVLQPAVRSRRPRSPTPAHG